MVSLLGWTARRSVQVRTGLNVGLLGIALSTGLTSSALAEAEIMVRKSMPFKACMDAIMAIPITMKAQAEQIKVEIDTGALYQIKVASSDANLVLSCNKVTDQVEIWRTTPGEWTDALASAAN